MPLWAKVPEDVPEKDFQRKRFPRTTIPPPFRLTHDWTCSPHNVSLVRSNILIIFFVNEKTRIE